MKPKEKNTNASERTMTGSDATAPQGAKEAAAKQKTATDPAEVIYRRFHQPVMLRELPGTSSLQSVIADLKKEGHGEGLRQARQEIAPMLEGSDRPTLRSLRLKAGLSQSELAEKAGLEQYQVSHYETGRDNPRFDTMLKLRKALDVDPNTLWMALEGKDD